MRLVAWASFPCLVSVALLDFPLFTRSGVDMHTGRGNEK